MGSWRQALLSTAVAVLVLAPYTAVAVPFQCGLVLQFLLILAALATARAVLGFRPSFSAWPPLVRGGLALYGAAAVWGLAVGMAAGNPLRYVASQTAAMLLLPLAAVALSGAGEAGRRALVGGVGVAIPAAITVHALSIAVPALGWADPLEPFRLLLRNDASLAGAAPLLLLVLLAWWLEARQPWGAVALAGAALLVLGVMSRGGWVVAGGGTAAVALLMARRKCRVVAVLTAGVAAVLLAWLAATAHVTRRDRVLLPRHGELSPQWVSAAGVGETWTPLVERLETRGAGLDIAGTCEGPDGSQALVVLHSSGDPEGERLALVTLAGRGRPMPFASLVPLRGEPQLLAISLFVDEGQGRWIVRGLRVTEVASRTHLLLRQFNRRLADLVKGLQAPLAERNLDYRARELQAVWAQWRAAPLHRWILGHGLGATFAFANSSWDDQGRRTTVPIASYIHNFYIFLAFKLGLVGGPLALAGLLAVLAWALREGVRRAGGERGRWAVTALGVGLVAYLVWSVVSPEIYDFRVAPLWGVLIAAAVASDPPEATRDRA